MTISKQLQKDTEIRKLAITTAIKTATEKIPKHKNNVRLISCGSCSLTPAQSRYATIELECLAVQWAISKCDFWLRGMPHFTVITDHRPLVGIFKKSLYTVENPILQRIRGKLAGYHFNTVWTPEGKLPQNLPHNHLAKSYSKIWNDLSLYEDDKHTLVLLNGHRNVVPCDIRSEILRILHLPHQGLVKTKQLARQCYYWPGINASITNLIDGCLTCLEFQPSQSHEPLLESTIPYVPMTHVGVDLFDALGKTYVVMVDRFSGFLFVSKITNSSTSTVTKILLKWFCDFGYPDVIRSDGGPCFRSEFSEICDQYFIKHELSSAYNPSSNGLAEAAVKNAKILLQKCKETGENFEQALSEFRLMPRADGFSIANLICRHLPAFKNKVSSKHNRLQDALYLNRGQNAQYNSPDIFNQSVGCLSQVQQDRLKIAIKQSPFVGISVDESTDISQKKHIAIIVRCIDMDDSLSLSNKLTKAEPETEARIEPELQFCAGMPGLSGNIKEFVMLSNSRSVSCDSLQQGLSLSSEFFKDPSAQTTSNQGNNEDGGPRGDPRGGSKRWAKEW
ncbi:hypothetical protein GQR58_026731 [Nymphon striatum]|nr:hypothetical protein GQR58_026731 [Nymphon striatum]